MSVDEGKWCSARLKEIVTYKKGKKPDILRPNGGRGFVPYLDIFAIERKEIRQYADAESSKLGSANDVLVVWDGARSGWVGLGQDGAIGSTIMSLQMLAGEGDYLFYFLKSQFDTINSNTRGTGIPHVDPEIFWNIDVPLPPLPEQRRIVEKLDKLLAKVEASRKRLENIPRILKRFRQSVLAAACSGKLTEDWRRENKTEPEWEDTTLDIVAEKIQIGPFGVQLHKADYVANGIPIVNPMHFQKYLVVPNPEFSISKKKYQELEKYRLQDGDIVVARRGEMGRCALVRTNGQKWLCGTGSLFVRPRKSVVPGFLFISLRGEQVKEYLEGESKGTTMDNLNLSILKNVPLSVPGLAEQYEIVRRVEQLFMFADRIEERYTKANAHVEKLTQSILAKAFRGELVPQDPNDEPASVLLERIRKEKELKQSQALTRLRLKLPRRFLNSRL